MDFDERFRNVTVVSQDYVVRIRRLLVEGVTRKVGSYDK